MRFLRIFTMLMFVAITALPHLAVAANVDQNIQPAAGLPGTEFSFYSTGFDGSEKVAFWFNTPNGQIIGNKEKYVVFAFKGRADWKWKSPDDAAQGYWSVVAKGITSGTERVISFFIGDPTNISASNPAQSSASTPSENSKKTAQVPDISVDPENGSRSEKFTFKATGFSKNEKVGYWFNDPAGTLYANPKKQLTTDDNGYVTWQWIAPDDAIYGMWRAVAYGVTSTTAREILFEIHDPAVSPQARTPSATPSANAQPDQVPSSPQPSSDLPPNPPEVSVNPLVSSPGTRISFYATGYPSGETVHYSITDPNGTEYVARKYNALTNGEGRADWNWRVPNNAMQGIWQMAVEGKTFPLQYTIFFEVRDPNAIIPKTSSDIVVDPLSGTPGSRFAFFATGFPAREKVSYWAVDPNNKKYDGSKYYVVSNNDGRADWSWKIPNDAVKGKWTMVAQGDKSLLMRKITFDIY